MALTDLVSKRSRLQPYDYVGALTRLGGDAELFRQVADFFLTDSKALFNRLRSALDHDDRKAVALTAHSLLGLAATFGATRVMAAADRIETAARTGFSPHRDDVDELQAALDALIVALQQPPSDAPLNRSR